MGAGQFKDGIATNRLSNGTYSDNFADLHAPLSAHEALVEADRCYFCYDAPCMNACPTEIDIPLFIRQISTGNALGSAKTIFEQNILGGMCARVCPTETLCEEVCVRETAEGKPVKIGQLQRFATDRAMANNTQFFYRAASSGKKIAIIGAGPAGLACAHRLAVLGHAVEIFDAREKSGGLNEYGIAAYKSTDDFAQAEVDYVTDIGGITIHHGQSLGSDITLDSLNDTFDATFLGLGLAGVNALRAKGEDASGVEDAIDYIAELRQAADFANMPIGRDVLVIGGGMTAIDIAVQAKLLGAENVTICYRRGKEQMNASDYEQDLATSNGVTIRHWVQPIEVYTQNGKATGLELEYTQLESGKLTGTGEKFHIEADQIFKAIGQTLDTSALGDTITIEGGRIKISDTGQTSHARVWAGGDCATGGDDLTVSAVAMGRDAALDIHAHLSKEGN